MIGDNYVNDIDGIVDVTNGITAGIWTSGLSCSNICLMTSRAI